MALAVLLTAAPVGAHPNTKHPQHRHCSVVKQIWSPARWRRGQPKAHTAAAFRRCPNWAKQKRRYYRARSRQLFRERVTPFHCSDAEMTFDGGWYAIPCANVDAESGGRGGWTCNTYGIIDPTWAAYGGPPGGACGNSEHTQSIIAAKIYRDVGTAAWTPFEP